MALQLLILSVFSCFVALESHAWQFTGFEWPSLDMGVLLERLRDPNYLKGDFTTEAMSTPNPRFIFGYLVHGLSVLCQMDWIQTFTIIKAVLVICVPPLYYLFFVNSVSSLNGKKDTVTECIAFAFVIFMLFSSHLQIKWMIGDYFQWELKATAHGISIFFALLGSFAIYKRRIRAGSLLFFAATLMHPTVGCLLFAIHFLFDWSNHSLRRLMVIVVKSVFTPLLLLLVLFRSPAPLPLSDFIQFYVFSRLPHHYHVASFDRPRLIALITTFCSMIALSVITLPKSVQKSARISAVCAILLIVFCMVAQWFFVSVFPFRPIVLLGPIRIFAFHWWIVGAFVGAFLIRLLGRRAENKSDTVSASKTIPAISILLPFCILLIAMISRFGGDPIGEEVANGESIYEWIKTTPEDSVFITPTDNMAETFPIVASRAVFISQVFPFREEFYPEYDVRWSKIYGPSRSSRHEYFDKLGPKDLQEIRKKYRLDYIIRKNDECAAWKNVRPIFQTKKWKVFALENPSHLGE